MRKDSKWRLHLFTRIFFIWVVKKSLGLQLLMRVLLSQISAYKTFDAWTSTEETLSILVADLAEYIKRSLKIEHNFYTTHLVRNMLRKQTFDSELVVAGFFFLFFPNMSFDMFIHCHWWAPCDMVLNCHQIDSLGSKKASFMSIPRTIDSPLKDPPSIVP